MTPAEELRFRIEIDARNVYDVISVPRERFTTEQIACVIADCAKRYMQARDIRSQIRDGGAVLELDAWENLVRALEWWR